MYNTLESACAISEHEFNFPAKHHWFILTVACGNPHKLSQTKTITRKVCRNEGIFGHKLFTTPIGKEKYIYKEYNAKSL